MPGAETEEVKMGLRPPGRHRHEGPECTTLYIHPHHTRKLDPPLVLPQ